MLTSAWLRSLCLALFVTVSALLFWFSHHAPPTLLRSVGFSHPNDPPNEVQVNAASPIAPHSANTESQSSAISLSAQAQHQHNDESFAYVFYATSTDYACSALINIARLQSQFLTPHRVVVLVHPDLPPTYLTALANHKAIVIPHHPPKLHDRSNPYYHDVLLKLVAFRLHQFVPGLKRILVLDSDQLIVQSLDHLFSLPAADIAAPRAYWLDQDSVPSPSSPPEPLSDSPGSIRVSFTSTLLLITLSDRLWAKVSAGIRRLGPETYDKDLLNQLFDKTALLLPGSYATLNTHWEINEAPNWFQGVVPTRRKDWVPGPAPKMPEHKIKTTKLRAQSSPFSSSRTKSQKPAPQPANITIEISESWTPLEKLSYRNRHREDRAQAERRDRLKDVLDTLSAQQTKIVHFSAVAKPWERSVSQIKQARPWAHRLLAAQFEAWRTEAKGLCPGQKELGV